MEVLRGFDALKGRAKLRTVATVGSYDGLHAAHYLLIDRCCREACRRNCSSMVVTFEPHPRITLGRDEGLKLLTTLEEKIFLLEQWGVDYLFVVDFDKDFSRISQEVFLRDYLVGQLGVECLIMGYNHRFGCDAGGNSASAVASNLQIDVVSIEQQFVAEMKVSSTVIRRTIASGDMALARLQLGHPYIIIGTVQCNRLLPDCRYKLLPTKGEYKAEIEDKCYLVEVTDNGVVLPTDEFENKKIVIRL